MQQMTPTEKYSLGLVRTLEFDKGYCPLRRRPLVPCLSLWCRSCKPLGVFQKKTAFRFISARRVAPPNPAETGPLRRPCHGTFANNGAPSCEVFHRIKISSQRILFQLDIATTKGVARVTPTATLEQQQL